MRVFIGYDPREAVAFHVCAGSIIRNSSIPVAITALHLPHLKSYREVHTDGSNPFTYSRFLVPALCDFQGWALYMDGDMVVKGDLADLQAMTVRLEAARCAVAVVKHDYKTKAPLKYLGNKNEDYPRKNWSSVILWNCGNSRNRVLSPKYVQEQTGAHLHRLQWIPDDEIAELPAAWNWLVEEYPHNDDAKVLHYTLGIPAFKEYAKCDHAGDWNDALRQANHCQQRS